MEVYISKFLKRYKVWIITISMMLLIVGNIVMFNHLKSTSGELSRQQSITVKTENELKKIQSDKITVETSLKEHQDLVQSISTENESLKVKLQAKKDEQARIARLAEMPRVVAPKAVSVSGSCEDWLAQAGITDLPNARILIQRESGCNPFADNPNSSAYGIPQALPGSKMASHGADWATNPVTQLKWMQSYVMGRYGSWANAVNHSTTKGWY